MKMPNFDLLCKWPILDSNNRRLCIGELMDLFHSVGYRAYVCGGAIRDTLSGEAINDIDLAVAASLPEIRSVVESIVGAEAIFEYLPQFGVLKIDTGCNYYVDIAMLRTPDDIDGAFSLEDVIYQKIGNLAEDARNRDLTINSGFWNPYDGLIDPLGCMESHVRIRKFGIAADNRKSAIDLRLSFRCLLFLVRGYRMLPDALQFVSDRLAIDIHKYDDRLACYIDTLTSGSPHIATRIHQEAKYFLDLKSSQRLQKACDNVGQK